jgi:hypothetical protein
MQTTPYFSPRRELGRTGFIAANLCGNPAEANRVKAYLQHLH